MSLNFTKCRPSADILCDHPPNELHNRHPDLWGFGFLFKKLAHQYDFCFGDCVWFYVVFELETCAEETDGRPDGRTGEEDP